MEFQLANNASHSQDLLLTHYYHFDQAQLQKFKYILLEVGSIIHIFPLLTLIIYTLLHFDLVSDTQSYIYVLSIMTTIPRCVVPFLT